MKKVFFMLALAATVFIACDNDKKKDDVVNHNLSEIIFGKWVNVEENGTPMVTNLKPVIDFVSTTKAYMSAAVRNDTIEMWVKRQELELVIDGKKIHLINKNDEQTIRDIEINVTSFNADEIVANSIIRNIINGDTTNLPSSVDLFKKINVDYSEAIIGMWEGRCTSSDGSIFDDGENHRWEYKSDGTYCYYYKENGEWKLSETDYSDYFVDGPMLYTRWKNKGEQSNNENWEIESIKDNVMKWSALRLKEDNTTYTVTFEMRKVE